MDDPPFCGTTPAREVIITSTSTSGGGPSHYFWVIFLNSQNGYTGHHLVSTGSLSAAIVHPREVLGPALREGAAHLVLLHNHPSGDPAPSKEDVVLTRQLAEGARLLGVRLHDHLIVGNGTGQWVSMAQRGLL
jgi:DNA repair protein RadC